MLCLVVTAEAIAIVFPFQEEKTAMLYLYHIAYITAHSSLDSVIDKQNPCAVGRLNIFVITMNTKGISHQSAHIVTL